ncbi:MAG: hypothetical protein AAGM22_04530, partial [Acidobacteriota bacterium]
MTPSALFLTLALLGLFVMLGFHRRSPPWRGLAHTLGLKHSRTGLWGELQGKTVEVYEDRGIVVVVHGVDPGFTIGRDSLRQQLAKPDILTGDRAFDERIRIEGNRSLALAALRDYVRQMVNSLVLDFNGTVEGRELRARLTSASDLESVLPRLLDLAQNLERPEPDEVPRELARIAEHDASKSVRLQALKELGGAFRGSPEALEAARAVDELDDVALQIEAGAILMRGAPSDQQRGQRLLATLILDRGHRPATRRSALMTLQTHADKEILEGMVTNLLAAESAAPVDIRRAAIRVCEYRRLTQPLMTTVPLDEPEWVRRIQALEVIGDTSVQPTLLDWLEEEKRSVRIAAIR